MAFPTSAELPCEPAPGALESDVEDFDNEDEVKPLSGRRKKAKALQKQKQKPGSFGAYRSYCKPTHHNHRGYVTITYITR
jgi:hypothetical protein